MQYLLISILAFCSVPLGMYIAFKSREELKTGKKYFLWLERILLLAIIGILASDYNLPLLWKGIMYLGAIIILLGRMPPATTYALLGIALGVTTSPALMGSVLFLYGLAHGSLAYIAYQRQNYVALLITRGIFFVTFLLSWKLF